MKKQLLPALLAALMTFSLAVCNKGDGRKVEIPAAQNVSENFQKNMHQSVSPKLPFACETEDGIYFQVKSGGTRAFVDHAKADYFFLLFFHALYMAVTIGSNTHIATNQPGECGINSFLLISCKIEYSRNKADSSN